MNFFLYSVNGVFHSQNFIRKRHLEFYSNFNNQFIVENQPDVHRPIMYWIDAAPFFNIRFSTIVLLIITHLLRCMVRISSTHSTAFSFVFSHYHLCFLYKNSSMTKVNCTSLFNAKIKTEIHLLK